MEDTKLKCKLCGRFFDDEEMSEEHYPARSVGNEDIVALNIVKMLDSFQSEEIRERIKTKLSDGESIERISGDIFDNELAESLYPHGRTARTLCRKCNTFLGKYDEAYLKFFSLDGEAKAIKGFSKKTKLHIVKSIFGKFISIPEATDEEFDFLEFLKNEMATEYHGKWKIYFVKRDFSSDLMGMKDIGTGKIEFDEGIVYELSDDKFIYNLMNFEKHACFEMTNLFDILKKDYILVKGVGSDGGYHSQILLTRLFSEMI
ncbi:hypothetical protein C804_05868 [Lachnospiraceae bacterium A4]|mgnify:CR=1 FL=1|jgi:hypothetical protein|nr:hypothetical protein C804_05868 [Lachnospiraceae bacterium A4]